MTKDEYKKYIDSLDAYREIKGVTENAIEEGRNSEKIEIAKKMIILKIDKNLIQQSTELSIEMINRLINEMKIKP